VIRAGRLLFGDCRRQAVDQIDVGLLHLLEELPGVPTTFDVGRCPGIPCEGERRLARAGKARDNDELVTGKSTSIF
jgi:hypothetical protein